MKVHMRITNALIDGREARGEREREKEDRRDCKGATICSLYASASL